MIVDCPNCASRMQLVAAKVPAHPFSVRCPKCQSIVSAQPPAAASNGSALAATGDLPTSARSSNDGATPSTPAPVSDSAPLAEEAVRLSDPSSTDQAELMRLLAALLQRNAVNTETPDRRAWKRRRVLICASPAHSEASARGLANRRRLINKDSTEEAPKGAYKMASDTEYEIYIAENTTQAIERMREDHMDIVILDHEFDPVEQGTAFITREINSLRPVDRRRVFFVQLSTAARTFDQHAAFVNHVNLIVNPSDLDDLPRALERAMRDFSELYRDFNKALLSVA